MARLILHSDDFGLHPAVNRAVVVAAQNGVLTSASLMVNGWAVEEAIAEARGLPGLGLGIHLNIIRGRPLTDPARIPSLVNRDGRFFNSMAKTLWRSLSGRINSREVYTEFRQQVLYMLERGLTPAHFDSEKHCHILLPEAALAVRRLHDEFGISRVRSIRETKLTGRLLDLGLSFQTSSRQRLKLLLLEYRSRKTQSLWTGLKSPDYTFGVCQSGRRFSAASSEALGAILAMPQKDCVEWIFHLGYPFDQRQAAFQKEFGRFFLDQTRLDELQFLLSGQVRGIIESGRDKLISYRDL